MKCTALVLLLCCLFGITSSNAQIKRPKNLDEAILYFRQQWPKDVVEEFKSKPEDDAVTKAHFAAGMWIRNTWIHGKRNRPLVKYFDSLGVYEPDDISSIILHSLHRALNARPVDVEKQADHYKSYWARHADEEKAREAKAQLVYDRFKKGDEITLYMAVDTFRGQNIAIVPDPAYGWKYDAGKDLMIRGTIVKKYSGRHGGGMSFRVLVNYLSKPDIPAPFRVIQVGDKRDFGLNGLSVE